MIISEIIMSEQTEFNKDAFLNSEMFPVGTSAWHDAAHYTLCTVTSKDKIEEEKPPNFRGPRHMARWNREQAYEPESSAKKFLGLLEKIRSSMLEHDKKREIYSRLLIQLENFFSHQQDFGDTSYVFLKILQQELHLLSTQRPDSWVDHVVLIKKVFSNSSSDAYSTKVSEELQQYQDVGHASDREDEDAVMLHHNRMKEAYSNILRSAMSDRLPNGLDDFNSRKLFERGLIEAQTDQEIEKFFATVDKALSLHEPDNGTVHLISRLLSLVEERDTYPNLLLTKRLYKVLKEMPYIYSEELEDNQVAVYIREEIKKLELMLGLLPSVEYSNDRLLRTDELFLERFSSEKKVGISWSEAVFVKRLPLPEWIAPGPQETSEGYYPLWNKVVDYIKKHQKWPDVLQMFPNHSKMHLELWAIPLNDGRTSLPVILFVDEDGKFYNCDLDLGSVPAPGTAVGDKVIYRDQSIPRCKKPTGLYLREGFNLRGLMSDGPKSTCETRINKYANGFYLDMQVDPYKKKCEIKLKARPDDSITEIQVKFDPEIDLLEGVKITLKSGTILKFSIQGELKSLLLYDTEGNKHSFYEDERKSKYVNMTQEEAEKYVFEQFGLDLLDVTQTLTNIMQNLNNSEDNMKDPIHLLAGSIVV